jgi:hypothetical protein
MANSATLLTGNARLLWWVGALLASLLWPGMTVLAHVGAPYPVLLEQALGSYVVSALADPDVGVGTFIVQVVSAERTAPPDDTVVMLWVTPQDGHADETGHQALRQMTKDGERFIGKVPFDARGMWDVRLVVEGSAGRGEVTFPVDVTPPYPGTLTTLVCLLPFVFLGGLWVAGALRSRRTPGPASEE